MSHGTFSPEIKVCQDATEMSEVARAAILNICKAHKDGDAPVSIALSGGSTPRKLYESLAKNDLALMADAKKVKFVFGDERLLPLEDADSNYQMIEKALLHSIPAEGVVAIDPTPAVPTSRDADNGEAGARKAAEDYEAKLLRALPVEEAEVEGKRVRVPVIDVVLLGFGPDGHTASIFPNSPASKELEHAVSVAFPSPSMSPKVWRITISPFVIQHAKHIIVMAAGKDKSWVVRNTLEETPTGEVPVARLLRESKGRVTFILDGESGARN